jgi:hypothetical protein
LVCYGLVIVNFLLDACSKRHRRLKIIIELELMQRRNLDRLILLWLQIVPLLLFLIQARLSLLLQIRGLRKQNTTASWLHVDLLSSHLLSARLQLLFDKFPHLLLIISKIRIHELETIDSLKSQVESFSLILELHRLQIRLFLQLCMLP